MPKQELGVDTTIKAVKEIFMPGGRARFEPRRSTLERLLAFTLAALWLLAAVAAAAVFFWYRLQ